MMKKITFAFMFMLAMMANVAMGANGPATAITSGTGTTATSTNTTTTDATNSYTPSPTADRVQQQVTGGITESGPLIKETFGSILSSMDRFQQQFTTTLERNNYGLKLLGGLSLIAFAWMGIQLVLRDDSGLMSIMANVIITGMRISFAYFLMTTGFDLIFTNGIDGSMNKLAGIALPSVTSATSGNDIITQGFTMFVQQQLALIGTMVDALGKMSMFEMLYSALPTAIIYVLLMICMLLGSILSMVMGLAAFATVKLAFCVAPIMIPWLVLEQTSSIFDGWVKMTIGACLTKLVIALLTGLGLAAVTGVTAMLNGNVANMLAVGLGGVVTIWMIAYMMLQAPQIAMSMISGGSIGMSSFGKGSGDKATKAAENAMPAPKGGAGGAIVSGTRSAAVNMAKQGASLATSGAKAVSGLGKIK